MNQIVKRARAKGIDVAYLTSMANTCKKSLKQQRNLKDLAANLHWMDAAYYGQEYGYISSEDCAWLIAEIKALNSQVAQ